MKFVAHLLSQDGVLTVTVDSSTYIINKTHVNYNALIKAFKENKPEEFVKLYRVVDAINASLSGTDVQVKDGVVYFRGSEVHNSICDRIVQLVREGEKVQYLINFLSNLMLNPSKNSLDQSFDFLAHKNLPITDDGCFLAYKTVRSDYMDKYTGTISNKVGEVIDWRHKRNQISDNPKEHCSQGLHVGALSYAGPGGWYNKVDDKVIIVKVNPQDIVCVPDDHSFSKMRVCRYEVIADYVAPLTHAVYPSDEVDEWDYDEYYEDDEDLDEYFDDEIDLEDLFFGDRVEFDYTGTDGTTERRYVLVDEYRHGLLKCHLLKGDPSYKLGEQQYRCFKKDYISNLRQIDN